MKYIVAGAGGFVGGQSTVLAGLLASETASIAYTGELLPTGTASYGGVSIDATKRYIKNSGKDKTPALVESGQGKFFNGTNQYINTGATPNDTVGTFVTRFTYASGAIQKIMAGMNYSNNRCYMGINASGKIGVGFGANTYDTLFSPDVLVAGRSYHVAFRYSGTEYWLFVDSVLKATGTITGLSSFVGTSFYIGALNNGGTASNYFNSVIDETYYYDVALTDAQIETLYKYPEKIKAYNGAIVPDIGSEANCKLFLPMCENAGSNVVNVAVAKGSEGFSDPTCSDSSKWLKGGTATVENGRLNWFGGIYISIREQNMPLITGKYYSITWDVVSYTSGQIRPTLVGGTQVSGSVVTAIGTYTQILQAATGNTDVGFQSTNVEFIGSIDNVSVKEITAYPLASYATTMHTSAAKLSYGAQCTAWKRDSLGVLLGMSNGLSFDKQISIKPLDTLWIPQASENYAIAVTQEILADGVAHASGFTTGIAPRLTLGESSNSQVQTVTNTTFNTGGGNNIAGSIVRLSLTKIGNVYTLYKNGVQVAQTTQTIAQDTRTWWFGAANGSSSFNMGSRLGFARVWKQAQLSKFDPVKDYQSSLKYVAKLGA